MDYVKSLIERYEKTNNYRPAVMLLREGLYNQLKEECESYWHGNLLSLGTFCGVIVKIGYNLPNEVQAIMMNEIEYKRYEQMILGIWSDNNE